MAWSSRSLTNGDMSLALETTRYNAVTLINTIDSKISGLFDSWLPAAGEAMAVFYVLLVVMISGLILDMMVPQETCAGMQDIDIKENARFCSPVAVDTGIAP